MSGLQNNRNSKPSQQKILIKSEQQICLPIASTSQLIGMSNIIGTSSAAAISGLTQPITSIAQVGTVNAPTPAQLQQAQAQQKPIQVFLNTIIIKLNFFCI